MNGGIPLLDLDACRLRQARFREYLTAARADVAVLVAPEHVEYLTGHRWDGRFAPLAAVSVDGDVLLVCPDKPVERAAADEVRTYEAKWRSTLRSLADQRAAAAAVLADWLAARLAGRRAARSAGRPAARRVGVEFSTCPRQVLDRLGDAECHDIDADLLRLRRRKDLDELANLRRAIAASGAMAARAREIVRPGVNELEVFSALQGAAVASCGEMLTATGNDYASGVRGGPPRDRACVAGELFILDLGPAYRGYFADISRTLAVDGRPTDEQTVACERVCAALSLVERIARPGVACRAIYEEVREWLAGAAVGSWSSHLGHGIGLSVHETPRLNPHWDDVLEEGDVIAVEPALYDPRLACGMRIENDYLVTATGLELLSPFPLGLA
jgi:Xaa-Pro dipeptidase